MQWMNQSGMLKITHNSRVKFSIGNYVYIVDCAVAPLCACHLLLGSSWKFDLDATHGGRPNNFSFIHKGVSLMLKPMIKSTIMAESFLLYERRRNKFLHRPKATDDFDSWERE
jgi:hypothetical protein